MSSAHRFRDLPNPIPLKYQSTARRIRDLQQNLIPLKSQQSTARRSRDLRQPASQNLIPLASHQSSLLLAAFVACASLLLSLSWLPNFHLF
jgi:hypothetical protein